MEMNITYHPFFNVFIVELQCRRSKYGDDYFGELNVTMGGVPCMYSNVSVNRTAKISN